MRQPGHTDTASPHQRECIDLDGAATASARRVRAERKLERPVQAVCSTELPTRSCLASEPAAHGTGAVALASSEGRRFHRRHGPCRTDRQVSGKRARHRRTERRCTVTREAFTDGAATATRVCASPATQAQSRHRAACATRRGCIDRSACGSARNERRLVPARFSQSNPSSSVVVGQRQRRLSRRRRRSSRNGHARRTAQRRPSHQYAQAPYRGARVTASVQLPIPLTSCTQHQGRND